MSLLRSYLFAPGHRTDLLEKVFRAGADAVVLDLEDAVPSAQKVASRESVAAALAQPRGPESPRAFVRINAASTGEWEADLFAVVRPGLHGIRVPKVESIDEVRRVDETVRAIEVERGLAPRSIELALAIESARGIESALELARASARVRNLCFGAADFVADIGADPGEDERETLYARSRLVVASRAARLDPPIAAVHTRLEDDAALRLTSEAARRLGFFGRSCVHPRQVPIVNAAFQPDAGAVERARRIVSASAGSTDAGAMTVDGEFVDEAVLRRARGLLALAERFAERERA